MILSPFQNIRLIETNTRLCISHFSEPSTNISFAHRVRSFPVQSDFSINNTWDCKTNYQLDFFFFLIIYWVPSLIRWVFIRMKKENLRLLAVLITFLDYWLCKDRKRTLTAKVNHIISYHFFFFFFFSPSSSQSITRQSYSILESAVGSDLWNSFIWIFLNWHCLSKLIRQSNS